MNKILQNTLETMNFFLNFFYQFASIVSIIKANYCTHSIIKYKQNIINTLDDIT